MEPGDDGALATFHRHDSTSSVPRYRFPHVPLGTGWSNEEVIQSEVRRLTTRRTTTHQGNTFQFTVKDSVEPVRGHRVDTPHSHDLKPGH